MLIFYCICMALVAFDFGLAVCNYEFWEKCGSVRFRVIMIQFGLLCLMSAEILTLITVAK